MFDWLKRKLAPTEKRFIGERAHVVAQRDLALDPDPGKKRYQVEVEKGGRRWMLTIDAEDRAAARYKAKEAVSYDGDMLDYDDSVMVVRLI